MSLRVRLALWYGGLIGLAMLTLGLVTYGIHSRAHYDDLDRTLAGAAEHAAEEYQLSRSSSVVSLTPYLVMRYYDAEGRPGEASIEELAPTFEPSDLLARGSSAPYDALIQLSPSFTPVDPGAGAFGLVEDSGGRRWRLYVLPLADPGGFMVAESPLDRIDAFIESFRMLVTLFALLAIVVTVIATWLVAVRALHPVDLLARAAHSITQSRNFAQRVPVDGRRDELGRLASTFNEMLGSLEEAYRAQQRFVADASHELRAPLTVLQANLELVQRRPELSREEQEESISEALRETRRLSTLVSDLLALARADAGVSLRMEKVELDRVLLESTGEVRRIAKGRKLEVGELQPAMVLGDADRLKQLILILLDNALKYTPADGTVTVELRRGAGTAELVVRDTGVGIPEAELPHVFERFYRADPARARDPGGTGLGLPIAQWIAEQHRGEVRLESRPGVGTTVSVRIPVVG